MAGLLTRILAPRASVGPAGAADDMWYSQIGRYSGAGIEITPDSAMTFGAFFAGVRVLSEGVAQLPLKMFRARPDGGSDEARNHPLYDVLHDRPNRWQTSFEWREMGQAHLILRGNFYNQIVPGPRGPVDQLIPLNPDKVLPKMGDDGILRYFYTPKPGQQQIFLWDEIFHVRGMSSDGIVGMSMLTAAREALGIGMAAERMAGSQFAHGSKLSGVLQTDKPLNRSQAKRLSESWQSAHAGVNNANKIAVLEDGMKWQAMGMTNEDAQWLQTRKFQVTEIARILRLPPHMLGDLEHATFTNIEHQGLEFVIYSLMSWLERWEQRISADLILAPQTYFAEFNVNALLRGDTPARFAAYQIGFLNGWLNDDEIRAMENLNPIPGGIGQRYFRGVHTIPLDSPGAEMGNILPPDKTNARAKALALAAAQRIVRKEQAALAKAPDVAAFYADHANFVASVLSIPEHLARGYTDKQAKAERGDTWEEDSILALARLALEEVGV